ncbi:MAG: hypothetical protein A2046_11310 [Bacteroidetes bacterium GWA2_30_7]|nr:MAG: hypothetical protein A2046_11310 [Bacteroidetes bacterium GWA2_30_7]
MKKLAICFLAILISANFLSAQKGNEEPVKVPNIPIDKETKLITYTKVLTIAGTKEELYKKALSWFNTFYKNPKDVIKEQNETDNKILGKHRFNFNNPPDKKGSTAYAGILQYSIYAYAKDGRVKYEIKDFNLKDASYHPIEYWLDKTSQKYTTKCDYYLLELDTKINEVIADFEKFMKTTEQKTNDNW